MAARILGFLEGEGPKGNLIEGDMGIAGGGILLPHVEQVTTKLVHFSALSLTKGARMFP